MNLVRETASASIERVYREHGPRIWRGVYAYCRDPDLATDAVAEAFAELLRRGDGVRDPAAWAWRTAFRVAAGALKERRRMSNEMPDRSAEMDESPVDLMRALARLSPKQRGALVLHYYAGYPVRDIARILDSTSSAVKVHLSTGRKRLRLILEADDAGP
ncbi:MAG: sigma-70 family RNA polymerase sigma factor [Actinomycetota bacterium]|nr:sigma-70 family RNA polymerase sigma factor [Actinomycetota bacterium]